MPFQHTSNPLPSVTNLQNAVIQTGYGGPVVADLGHPDTMPGVVINDVDVKLPFEHEVVRDIFNNPLADIGSQFELMVSFDCVVLARASVTTDDTMHVVQPMALIDADAVACLRPSDTRGFIDPVTGATTDDVFLVTKAETKNSRQKLGVDSFDLAFRRYATA